MKHYDIEFNVVGWAVMVCGGPYAATLLVPTPTFQWYMTRLVVKNRFLKDPCSSGVGVCTARDVDTVLGLMVGTIGKV